ncbi:MAG: hypothetical protein ACYC28_05040 [Longimicrobiales bacterium]
MNQPNDASTPHGGHAADLFRRLLRTSTAVEYLEVHPDGTIACANDAFARHVGGAGADIAGHDIGTYLTEHNTVTVRAWAAGADLPDDPQLLNFVDAGQQPYTLRCVVARDAGRLILMGEADAEGQRVTAEQLLKLNNEFATMTRELTRRTRELEQTRQQLARTREELERLRGEGSQS